jgi:hypothetical protein
MKCPHCGENIPEKEIARHLAARGGRKKSEAKAAAARANARRPRPRARRKKGPPDAGGKSD